MAIMIQTATDSLRVCTTKVLGASKLYIPDST